MLDQGVLEKLGHKVFDFPCYDASHLFLCLACKLYSSCAQVVGLSKPCKPPTVTGRKNSSKLKRGIHPDKVGVHVDLDEFIPLFHEYFFLVLSSENCSK